MTKIIGIGTDIIEIIRIKEALKRHGQKILDKIFTIDEQAYCLKLSNPYPSFAARFAAKEAVAKALGTGIGKTLGWKHIEIIKINRQPQINMSPTLESLDVSDIKISLSHSTLYATAVAIAYSS